MFRLGLFLVGTFTLLGIRSIFAHPAHPLFNAHATFYGGNDGSGTMGGACGYGNPYTTGYGLSTTALSVALFHNGRSCGSCFIIYCDHSQTSICYPGKHIIVTATNECPNGSNGGWCDEPKPHFDLSYPMFTTLAPEIYGHFPVLYKRVPCRKSGGIRFTFDGTPWWTSILVTNVGSWGNVASLKLKGDNTDWYTTTQSWGQNWVVDGYHPELVGTPLSFQVILGAGRTGYFYDACPANWGFSQTCEASSNM